MPASRGPKPGITVARIIDAAIEIADAEGLGALSMRRVANHLNAGTMSLYRHVRDKDELIARMVDSVFAEDPFPDPPPDGWRARLELAARRLWGIFMRHPWVVPLISITRPLIGPNGMHQTEWALAAVAETGVDSATVAHVVLSLTSFTVGAAMPVAGEIEAERRTGVTADAWMEAQAPLLERVFASGRFPMIVEHFADDDIIRPDVWFEVGLRSLLDGIALQIESNQR